MMDQRTTEKKKGLVSIQHDLQPLHLVILGNSEKDSVAYRSVSVSLLSGFCLVRVPVCVCVCVCVCVLYMM